MVTGSLQGNYDCGADGHVHHLQSRVAPGEVFADIIPSYLYSSESSYDAPSHEVGAKHSARPDTFAMGHAKRLPQTPYAWNAPSSTGTAGKAA